MINPLHLPSRDESIEAAAADWLARRDDGLTPEEEKAFARWQSADPRHAEAVARLGGAWAAMRQLGDYLPEGHGRPDPDFLSPRGPARTVQFAVRIVLPMAAAAAVALAAAWFWPRARPEPLPVAAPTAAVTVYATAPDDYRRLTLEDGSVLELNAGSQVQVSFTAAERSVKLVRGEVQFTVAKNRNRPFLVEAAGVTVRAVGTAFDVRIGLREVEILVTEGKVQVSQPGAAAGRPADFIGGEMPVLVAGQRMILPSAADARPRVETLVAEAMREALSWQQERLRFVDTPLADVIQQFNRRNTTQIELGDAGLASLSVDGSFRAENVETFVRMLESNGGIRVERPRADRIILRRAR